MANPFEPTPDNIRRLRARLGLSQVELAARLGVAYTSVNRWENGHTKPYRWVWERLLAMAGGSAVSDLQSMQSSPTLHADQRTRTQLNAASPPRIDFQASPEAVRVAVEAEWLAYGYLVNPTFAAETSLIDPLPHQRIAVYDVMLPQPRLRFLLADDAGAGKTIMTGLYIREMLLRHRLRRVLIVSPAGLVGNWQRELDTLFRLTFRIVSGADGRQGNPFVGQASQQIIVSVDTLAGDRMREWLRAPEVEPYDLVVFDEAHKLAADQEPDGSIRKTQRYRLAEALVGASTEPEEELGWAARHVLLLTATPHMGKPYPYFALWHLLEPEALSTPEMLERYDEQQRDRHYIRRTKEEMVTFDGRRLYPTRESKTLAYPLEGLERTLYDRTTEYIRSSYNRAAILNRSAARLAMSVFQRRLASSAYALLRSLERRLERLNEYLTKATAGQLDLLSIQKAQQEWTDDLETKTADEESGEGGREEHENSEEKALSALVASSIPELRRERDEVLGLIDLAREVLDEQDEAKFVRLRELVRDPQFQGEKLLIFTEHRDTLQYLTERLEALGFEGRLAWIHGGMPYLDREAQVARFRLPGSQGGADILIATDAAGEGINLQFCWVMVNYDIPWNPARLEQRMGRIHRYKQQHDPVLIFNLVADNTREGRVIKTLLDKLELIRKELKSDKVFDVIGQQLAGLSLRDLILEAMDDEAAVHQVDAHFNVQRAAEAIHAMDRVLAPAGDVLNQLPEQRERLRRESYQRLLPGYVRHFLEHSAPLLGIGWEGQLDGVFSLKPLKPGSLDVLWPLMERYDPSLRNQWTLSKPEGQDNAIFFHPGEPVFDAYRAWVAGQYADQALRGAVFIDPEVSQAYTFHLALAQVVERDPDRPGTKTVRATRLIGIRHWTDGRIEEVPAEHLLLLRPGNRIPPEWVKVAANAEIAREQVQKYLVETVRRRVFDPLQAEVRHAVDEEWRWVESGYQALEADLAIQRSRFTKRIREGERSLQGHLTLIKRRQATLDDEKARAKERIMNRTDALELEPIEFLAHALVVPSQDPILRQQYDADVERIAMAVTQSLLEQEGFRVWDVSTPAKAQAVGLSAWPGFDLLARHPDGRERAVEVKGRATRGEIVVSDNEWVKACNLRDHYWLYVVWDCASPHPYAIPIADPFGRLLTRAQGGVVISASEIAQVAQSQ
ncbi:MAG: helicase-related protein [Firmicutes bacterium]|nr:helicase-related protein [Bacillota bacterium]